MVNVKIAEKFEVPPNTMLGVQIKGKYILLANVEGEYFAVDGLCSHMKGKLWEGTLKGKVVKCPRHGSEFDLATGRLVKKPWLPLGKATNINSYRVTIQEDEIFVDV